MNNWRILITFTLPNEAYIVKGRLESEGIVVMLKDELTAQVNNFYSNAIGGVKLLVHDSDFDRAYQILIETGYLKNEVIKVQNNLLSRFVSFSSRIPLLGKLRFEIRFLILVTVILIIIIVPVFLLSLPSTVEKLTANSWCVEKIYFNGKEIIPNSYGMKLRSNYDNCSETIEFRENGDVVFPGFDSYEVWHKWEILNDSIIITNRSSESENANNATIYIGKYFIEISNDYIKLKSKNMIIIGRVYKFIFSF